MFQSGIVLNDRYRILRVLGQGGFSQTYEVEDLKGEQDRTKLVLKVLLEDYPKAVDLFRREAKVLSLLDHPGIPRVETDSYFTMPSEGKRQLYCLVMERIPGINLHQWMSRRRFVPIGTTKAIDWLFQMVDILATIHQCQCFHRDIKPSNIILRPNGRLALVDFGAVREVTQTYLHKRDDDVARTHIYSRGYTPIEQMQGRAVPASDFFALGRTFVHLMTGCNPLEFPTDSDSGQIIWHHKASQIILPLAQLINDLMAPRVAHRPREVSQIYDTLITICQALDTGKMGEEIDPYAETVIYSRPPDDQGAQIQNRGVEAANGADSNLDHSVLDHSVLDHSVGDDSELTQAPSEHAFTRSEAKAEVDASNKVLLPLSGNRDRPWNRLMRRPIVATIAWSCVAIAGVTGVRLSGLLQSIELATLDMMMQLRPEEPVDSRLLLITIDESDLAYQAQNDMPLNGSALSDQALYNLLEKIYSYRPSAIGLDIYRYTTTLSDLNPAAPEQSEDQSYLLKYDDLFVVCSTTHSVEPLSTIPTERIGFVDIPLDPDRRVRRQILGMTPSDRCQTDKSLSYQLAAAHLAQQQINAQLIGQTLYFGDRPIPSLASRRGGYYDSEMGGYEILINYRKSELIGQRISLEDILEGRLDQNLDDLVRNRLILIGTVAPSFKDYHETPYGTLAGIEIHAQMTSQLISFMLDDRPLISTWPLWGEALWLSLWAGASAAIICWRRSPRQRVTGVLLLIVAMVGSSYLVFLTGLWVPLVPAGLSIAIVSGGLSLIKSSEPIATRKS
ncbi:MAG: CHASE2 domain-containing protein [Elainellaceae cyanobacterium]